MRKLFFSIFIIGLAFTACKKADFDNAVTGEAVGALTLLSPDADSVILNPATPTQTITFAWSPASPGVNSTVKYRLIAKRREAANFDPENRVFELSSDNDGLSNQLTTTYKQLDDVLKANGFANAQRVELAWTVEAYNDKSGSTLASSSNVFIVKRSPNGDGAKPFSILGPSNLSTLVILNPDNTADSLKFNWTKSSPAVASTGIVYTVRFYDGDVTDAPVFTMQANSNGIDTFRAISHKDMVDTLIKYGLPKMAELKWNVAATSGTFTQVSDYTNDVAISRLTPYSYPKALNVAGNFQGWSPSTAPQLVSIPDNGEFEGFIFFNDDAPLFKLVKGNDWSAGDYGSPGAPTLTNGGDNITLPSKGHYRLHVNTNDMTWGYTQINSWGVIGSATPGGWDNDTDMTYNPATGAWEVTLNLVPGALKFRANDSWDINFGDSGNDGTLEYGGADIPVSSGGTYKVSLNLSYGGNWFYTIKKS